MPSAKRCDKWGEQWKSKMGWMSPNLTILATLRLRTSSERMKRYGAKGSPCLNPHSGAKKAQLSLLVRTDPVEKHTLPDKVNPRFRETKVTKRMKKKIPTYQRLWKYQASDKKGPLIFNSWARAIGSCIVLPFTKAYWKEEKMEGRVEANIEAKSMVMILKEKFRKLVSL